MTIKINGNGFNTIAPLDKNKRSDKAQKNTNSAQSSVDRVQFSSLLEQTTQARAASGSTETDRAEKLQSLKEQIAEGNYRPDSAKVAASLLKFLAENQGE